MEMALESHFDDSQLVEIGDYVKSHLKVWIREAQPVVPPPMYDRDLMERMVRVEEEIKHLTKAVYEGFERFDKRFDENRKDMLDRFAAVDKRFEAMQASIDKRFESMQTSMDKRFDQMFSLIKITMTFMGVGFTMLTVLITVFKFVG